jgi:hypothetical protein
VKIVSKKEIEKLIMVSPSGHKYEVTVSDSGSLIVTLAEKDEKEA